jgi:hypothetical protein
MRGWDVYLTVNQALNFWDQLVGCYYNCNTYGGDVCEIYLYTMMEHKPTFAHSPNSVFVEDEVVVAKRNILDLIKRFQNAYDCLVTMENGMIDLAMLPPFELPYPQPKKVVAPVSKDDHAQAIQRICEFMNTQFDALPDSEHEKTVSRARRLADSLRMLHPTYEFEAHPVTDGKGDRSVRLCYWSNDQ